MSAKELKDTHPRTDVNVGDLVQFVPPQVSGVDLFTGPDDPRIKVGVYLGEKTFDKDRGNYTCSMVYFTDDPPQLSQPRPVQSNLIYPLGGGPWK